ncbi:MAG: hypothetical protein VKN13_06150 [Cyanobacteriota bacterium]|nr:hypothetical protein [Cyanobacteriota bacterium]
MNDLPVCHDAYRCRVLDLRCRLQTMGERLAESCSLEVRELLEAQMELLEGNLSAIAAELIGSAGGEALDET